MARLLQSLSDAPFFPSLVTLAWGDLEAPTLATVVFLSAQADADTKSVASALVQHARSVLPQKPAFEWSTLKLGGDTAASEAELAALVEAATQGTVGIARATKLKLN